jgi:TonB-dependent SusC/RagA subfamily outer membrane receptor
VSQLEAAQVTEQVAIRDVQELLTSRTPGLQFRRVGGGVGIGSSMQIRGTGSFSLTSDPLIYVDGVRINSTSSAGPDISSGSQVNVLNDLNPEEIESIEIIKGPAAATLYGTEASEGVIQIITKKGREGAPQFDFSVTQGSNFLTNIREKIGDAYYCSSSPFPPCPPQDLVRYNMYDEANKYISGEVLGPDGQPFFDWPTDELYQAGRSHSYDLSLRGGSPSVRYYLSANYASEEGIDWYNYNHSYRLRANVGTVLSESWNLDVSSSYVTGATRFPTPVEGQGGSWTNTKVSHGRCLLRVALDDCPRLGGFYSQRPDDAANVEATRDFTHFTGSATLNHTLGDWLTQRFVLGIDKAWDKNQHIIPIDVTGSGQCPLSARPGLRIHYVGRGAVLHA